VACVVKSVVVLSQSSLYHCLALVLATLGAYGPYSGGGGVHCDLGGQATLVDSAISECSCYRVVYDMGGAFVPLRWSADGSMMSSCHLVGTSISSCTASYGGATLAISPCILDSCTVSNCTGTLGGFMYSYFSPSQLTNSLISFCTAAATGGALLVEYDAGAPVALVNVTIAHCSAQRGGGAVVRHSKRVEASHLKEAA